VNPCAQVLDEDFDSTSHREVRRNDMENVDALSHRILHLDADRSAVRGAAVIESNTRLTIGEFR
jgi:hypothetical protein